ncbi:hemerythrin domain-containing protein [Maribellus sp. CM-23]|uniref:hemerythrin domain-containing protein n=1 Tax=Maribellus sp. CM-23 TaxID=2781026 RepID=UPI001F243C93|nr:hemerythrin domain-containing protein [Maribellus sp. CM-23]MCE4566802.1 hemerythrin domain-containing protein [Maribellus sp. CM-23]
METIRLFAAPHKALRKTMADFMVMIGQTNFDNMRAVAKLKKAGREMFFLLSSHAETEDRIILKALEQKVPGAADHDKNDHVKIERLQRSLEIHLNLLSTSVRTDEAHDFYLEFARFYSLYLEHIDEEETLTQRLIWEHFSKEEQLGIRASIVAKMDTETYAVWLKHMIPAQNEAENRMMLGAIRNNMPADRFHALMERMGESMPEDDFLTLGIQLSALAIQD